MDVHVNRPQNTQRHFVDVCPRNVHRIVHVYTESEVLQNPDIAGQNIYFYIMLVISVAGASINVAVYVVGWTAASYMA